MTSRNSSSRSAGACTRGGHDDAWHYVGARGEWCATRCVYVSPIRRQQIRKIEIAQCLALADERQFVEVVVNGGIRRTFVLIRTSMTVMPHRRSISLPGRTPLGRHVEFGKRT